MPTWVENLESIQIIKESTNSVYIYVPSDVFAPMGVHVRQKERSRWLLSEVQIESADIYKYKFRFLLQGRSPAISSPATPFVGEACKVQIDIFRESVKRSGHNRECRFVNVILQCLGFPIFYSKDACNVINGNLIG